MSVQRIMNSGNSFAHILRSQRQERRWSLKDMCRKLKQQGIELSDTYICRIESGKEIPSPERIVMFADFFGIDRYDTWQVAKAEKIHWYSNKIDREYERCRKHVQEAADG